MTYAKILGLFSALAGLAVSSINGATFVNSNAIAIPDVGNGVPFPSTVTVSGLSGTISGITVTLFDLSHDFISDVDVLLVSPSGTSVLLFSNVGLFATVSNLTLTFADGSPMLPEVTAPTSGTYSPTSYGGFANFSPPAPPPPYGASLSLLSGEAPNGAWKLFVSDALDEGKGQIAGGFALNINTTGGVSVPDSGSTLAMFGFGLISLLAARRKCSLSA